jgi:hypothetical protein
MQAVKKRNFESVASIFQGQETGCALEYITVCSRHVAFLFNDKPEGRGRCFITTIIQTLL